jgi:hypothetical protein
MRILRLEFLFCDNRFVSNAVDHTLLRNMQSKLQKSCADGASIYRDHQILPHDSTNTRVCASIQRPMAILVNILYKSYEPWQKMETEIFCSL